MASENQYSPGVVTYTGGLDFTTAKPSAAQGTLSDSLNVEVGTRAGYGRIAGMERHDGGLYNPSANYTNLVLFQTNAATGPFLDGELLEIGDDAYKGKSRTIGRFLETVLIGFPSEDLAVEAWFVLLVTNYESYLALQENSSTIVGATSTEVAQFATTHPYTLDNAQQESSLVNSYFYEDNISRTAPNSIAGADNNPITGLKLYKEQLYATSDFVAHDFTVGSTEVFSGDVLTDGSAHTARIVDVQISSGSWAGGNAVGQVLIAPISGAVTGASTVNRLGSPVAAMTLGSVSSVDSWAAGMWRTTSAGGWEEVNIGYEFTFRDGQPAGPPPTYNRGNSNNSFFPVQASSGGGTASSFGTTPWATTANVLVDDAAVTTSASNLEVDDATLVVTNFSAIAGILADSEIVGLQLMVRGAVTPDASKLPTLQVQCVSGGTGVGTFKMSPLLTGTTTDYVLGGPEDLWGISNIKSYLNSSFGFNVVARLGTPGGGATTFRVAYMELTVYYTGTISKYYFYDGVDDVEAPITNYVVDSGDWTTSDAHGFMQVASITPYDHSTRTFIKANDEIWTAPGGTGALLATVESNAVYAGLAPYKDLQDNSSRYEMIVANFYGNEDWEAIYGVNGAGRGFSYDGYYMRRLYTGLPSDTDKPRHVAFNQHCLALGYASGNVTQSVQGEPENYSGVDGATSFDVGDPVTGLLRMNGTTLGIFCRNSISGLTGTSTDNFALSVLSPYEGAIEYTVVDGGGKPIYCSNKGISVFDQTAAYGSFLGNRLSALVAPWLLPRLQNKTVPSTFAGQTTPASGATGLLFAAVVRSKNQLRLYFADGVCLTMTLFGAEQAPMFTLQQYDKWTTPASRLDGIPYTKFLPLAYTSDIDNSGKERVFMSHYDGVRDSLNDEAVYYAYEFEDSWSFEGFPIEWSMTLNENFYGTPFDFDTFRKLRIHGVSQGYAPMKLEMTNNYNDPLNATPVAVDINLPRSPTAAILDSLEPKTNIQTMPKYGRSFSTRLFYDRTGTNQVYPPFVVQVSQIQHKDGKGDV